MKMFDSEARRRFSFLWALGQAILRPSPSRQSRGEDASAALRTPGVRLGFRGRGGNGAFPERTPGSRAARGPCPRAPNPAVDHHSRLRKRPGSRTRSCCQTYHPKCDARYPFQPNKYVQINA